MLQLAPVSPTVFLNRQLMLNFSMFLNLTCNIMKIFSNFWASENIACTTQLTQFVNALLNLHRYQIST